MHLAGGLPEEERGRFEGHRDVCAECARDLDAMGQMEKTMTQVFSAVVPGANFEDRLIAGLRLRGPRLAINPLVRRAAIAASAAIVLGGFGFVASRQMDRGGLDPNRIAFNLRQIGQADSLYSNENHGEFPRLQVSKWDFGGGSNTALGWSNWNTAGGKITGENTFGGEHHVEFQRNPFPGVQRDMTFARRGEVTRESVAANGAVLVPPDDAEQVQQKLIRERVDSGVDRKQAENAPAAPRFYVGALVTTEESGKPGQSNKDVDLYYKPTEVGDLTIAGKGDVGLITNGPIQLGTTGLTEFDARNRRVAGHDFTALADVPSLETPKEKNEKVGFAIADQNGASAPGAAAQPVEQNAPRPAPTTQGIERKVIRNGDIEFEVDSFDSATMTITKIAKEEQGYIATTNSEKLPNGKVKGVIVVRVAPDHLDTLVMKLRALGDLKSQNLTAQDVTKQYTDSASELRAARAMEDRLLNIIKTSQGQIKDLLAVEKELATWRGKIETLEGQLRYYDSLVAQSTLNISLYERDIKTAATTKEQENVDMGVEAEDVETARANAIKAIDNAKGRIVESELKKLDAGELAAKIVAEISPDASGPAIDRLKQLGKVARLEITRAQTTANGQPPLPGTKLERGETHLVLSLYNLANVAPRETSNLTLAAENVEQAYQTIAARVTKSGGRVVTSNLNRQTAEQTSGVIQFEVKEADSETSLSEIRKVGEVTRLTVAQNPDTNNVTAAKRGFNVQIVSLASMLPREVNNRTLSSGDVDGSFKNLLDALRGANARVVVSHTEDVGQGQRTGYLDFEIARPQLDAVEKSLAAAGETVDRSVNTSANADNVSDAKVQFKLKIVAAATLPAREIHELAIETGDVDAAAQGLQNAAKSIGGKIVDSNFSKDEHGQTARLIVEVPLSAANQMVAAAKQLGTVRGSRESTNQQAPTGETSRARVEVTLASGDFLVAPENGFFATIRHGLATSFAGLMWSLQLIVIGLCLVGPWVLLVWGGVKWWRRARRKTGVVSG